mgnify:FL=1
MYSSINQQFAIINVFSENRVSDSFIFQQVYVSSKEFFKRKLEVKVIVGIIFQRHFIEINHQIHITVVIESVSQNGTENKQLPDLVLFAQGYNFLNIVLYQFHNAVFFCLQK